ncbi:MAG: YggS family pyridoxal phosphate-dependent enzyme [Desulfofustis sp.]|nr:YggS family pyridoxal phosphate-dependent enzyme [Desulfofustis sp.]
MPTIRQNLDKIRSSINDIALRCHRNPDDIQLVAVSKRFPVAAIEEALAANHVVFGENYIQEAAEKKQTLDNRIKLHFIGHLQSNKARTAVEYCDMIETIDRPKIVKALHKHLESENWCLDVLVQVNVGQESQKSGVLPQDAESLLAYMQDFPRLKLRGLMTMPPYTPDPEMVRSSFRSLREIAVMMEAKNLLGRHGKIELSMGMSHDYHVAIEEGATLIRIGTAIFGERPPLSQNR